MDILIDPDLVVQRRRRAARSFDPKAGFLMDIAADELSIRLSAVERHFERAAELFGGTGAVAAAAMSTGKIGTLYRVDVVPEARTELTAATLEDVPL
jgi:hypothetical protein